MGNAKPIAQNGWEILEYRKRGYRPDEMIIVSLVGKIPDLNHVIYADYRKDYDWRYLKDVDVCVFASSGVDWLKTVKAISEANPAFLGLWDVDRLEGADFWKKPLESSINKPKQHWQWELVAFPWIPMQNRMFQGVQ